MILRSQRSNQRDPALSALDGFIQAPTVAKDTCGVPPTQIALAPARTIPTTIKNTMDNKDAYIDLGPSCAGVCEALDRGLNGKRLDNLNKPVQKAIEKLTTTVADIQGRVDEKNSRKTFSRVLHAQRDKDTIAARKEDLDRLLDIFDTELAIDTNVMVTDNHRGVTGIHQEVTSIHRGVTNMHQDVSAIKECVFNKQCLNQASVSLGELPPPAPKAFFGRDTLIEEVVALAEKFAPIALIGAGGIGKTSVALAVLHHHRIERKFGDNRRFLHCDKFEPSLPNFLAQLSKVIGAGVQNPDNLDSLRPFLSRKKMVLFLDNAESILDPQGTDAREIYIVVEELGRFDNICLGITSRIRTVPPHCKRPFIATLSVESACQIFYSIHDDGGESDIIRDLVGRLDFHALSITLIATAASHNAWDYNQLFEEWNTERAQVLRTDYDQSLAATIELSLASPTFRKLGPSARELLGVIAFFPQGVDRNNLRWLFPTIPNVKSAFDKFCTLSLTYRNGDFFTMLAPIRDYLTPNNPTSSPLLCKTKDQYITRLSVGVDPNKAGFEEAGWIVSEDVNVEHLLNTFASRTAHVGDIWYACSNFLEHLRWHKPRKTVLGSAVEGLPDTHPLKSKCLFELSELSDRVGDDSERKRFITSALKLERERGSRPRIAQALVRLSDVNRRLQLFEEGLEQTKEASEIYEQLGDTVGQANSLKTLAHIFYDNNQLDAAEAIAFRAVNLFPERGQELLLCQFHRYLWPVYQRKGQKEKAIHHLETAIDIASRFKWHNESFWGHFNLARLFLDEDELAEANDHVEQAKLYAVNNTYFLGRTMEMQAIIWQRQRRHEDAEPELSRAFKILESLGAEHDAKRCRDFLRTWKECTSSSNLSQNLYHQSE